MFSFVVGVKYCRAYHAKRIQRKSYRRQQPAMGQIAHAQKQLVLGCKRRLTNARSSYTGTIRTIQAVSDARENIVKTYSTCRTSTPQFFSGTSRKKKANRILLPRAFRYIIRTRKSDGMASPATVFQRAIARCRIARYPISMPTIAAAANDACR